MRRFFDGLDRRIGHRKLLHELLDEPVQGGASWAYVFGSASLILFLVQLGTGLVLATFYSPSSTDAWASVAYIEREIAMGRALRGVHHHAASAMVIVVGLHFLQVSLYGAYKAPREGNWLSGLALLGLVLAFALTGYLLPWDQTGYWATKVATSIAGTVPVIGEFLQKFLQGGNDYGSLTLTRFYALHVILLPLLTLGLLGMHLALFRKHGVTPRAGLSEAQLKRVDTFWPKQVAFDSVFALLVIAAIIALALAKGAPLEAPADPASNFIARPEWYFLFLFQLLKYFEGPLEIVGTIIIPGAVTAFLALLPFLDRAPSRLIRDRKPFISAIGFGMFAIVALTFLALRSDRNNPAIADQKQIALREADRAKTLAAFGVPPEGAAIMVSRDPLVRGERVFRRECSSCHPLDGHVPAEIKGPELTGYRSKAWIRQILRDPDSKRLFGHTKVFGMKSFATLPERDLQKLVDYLYGLRADPPAQLTPDVEKLIDDNDCGDCHDFEEAYGLDGPALFKYGSRTWVEDVVKNAGADHLYGDANEMPIFAERLSAADLDATVTWLLTLEDRGSKDGWPWKDDPGPITPPRTSSTAGVAPER